MSSSFLGLDEVQHDRRRDRQVEDPLVWKDALARLKG